ncbi:MAG: hypothetical protein ACOC2U_04000 [bacterium]
MLYITVKTEFEKYFEEHPDFPQDLYDVLMEHIEITELSGNAWSIQRYGNIFVFDAPECTSATYNINNFV